MTFTVTKEVKIIMFQCKVIHNVLPTCTTLYHDGLIEDATCNLCNAMEQTLTHLLINCATKAESWTSFQNWWCEKKSEIIKLSASHILYCWLNWTKHWHVLNYCLLIAKHSIFFCLSMKNLKFLKRLWLKIILCLVTIANGLFSFNYAHFDVLKKKGFRMSLFCNQKVLLDV